MDETNDCGCFVGLYGYGWIIGCIVDGFYFSCYIAFFCVAEDYPYYIASGSVLPTFEDEVR